MKLIALILICFLLIVSFAGVVFANKSAVEEIYDEFAGKSIAEQIKPGENRDATAILVEIEQKISAVVATVRVIATIFAVMFFIWIGLVFFTAGGSPQKLMGAKTQVAMFFVSMLCIFAAEPIVRFVLSWFISL